MNVIKQLLENNNIATDKDLYIDGRGGIALQRQGDEFKDLCTED